MTKNKRFKAEKVLGWTIPLSTLVRLQRQAIRKYLLQKVPITFLIHILLLIKYFCPAGKRTFRIPFLMENNIPNIFPNIMEIIGFIKWYVPIVTIRLRWFFGFWKMKRHYTFSIVAGDPVSQNSAPFSSIWQKIFQQKKGKMKWTKTTNQVFLTMCFELIKHTKEQSKPLCYLACMCRIYTCHMPCRS